MGTDEGFFSLALHSFIENYIQTIFEPARDLEKFGDKVEEYKQAKVNSVPQERRRDFIKTLVRIQKEHNSTNAVRHNFRRLSGEEATAMTHNFLKFCRHTGLASLDGLSTLEQNIEEAWKDKTAPLTQREELQRMQFRLMMEQRKSKKLDEDIKRVEEEDRKIEELKTELQQLRRQLDESTRVAEDRDQKIDELRNRRNELQQELKQARKRAEELEPVREHLSYLERLSNYSRTRRDYERSVITLTPEQTEVLDKIKLNHDYLIKGSAGTGKTLVLLKALNKALELSGQELGLDDSGAGDHDRKRIVLLTYTRTLVRYNRYLDEIMNQRDLGSNITTSESFFLDKLRQIDPSYEIDYRIVENLVKELDTPDFLTDRELSTEIEDFIFAGAVTREEYIDLSIPRRGLKKPLNTKQRSEVWRIVEQIIDEMEERGVFSKSYSRLKILRHLRDAPGDGRIHDAGFIFIDESQDLTAVELMTLKALASRPLIMAGDVDQSIYGFSSPYARADIQLKGRSTTLKLNFRNTAAIHRFAELYRSVSEELDYDESRQSHAFREGPVPELLSEKESKPLMQRLVDRAQTFIDRLGYDPENISILVPTKREIEKFSAELEKRGYHAENIKDPDFDFGNEDVVRLSTLHSSKGVDFPVVLLYLPYLPPMKDVDEPTLNKMYHNLLYVACTRAMDHLVIGIKEESGRKPIEDLTKAYSKLFEDMNKE
jgi:hypothetical protein